ncbi:unnamed protein product [Candida verbasci]|uniref:Uncharacterized protein n=1 Tax=Candida verbasci TaxID=1227364 RepID=A0A9W4TUD4_9ASCO|nr:unnamed protein product [Candida verbasci]
MQAIECHGRENLKYTTNKELPRLIHPHDVKIKILYCGICGSDLHEYLDGPIFFADETNPITLKTKYGQAMGHEISGEIVELGSDVDRNLSIGQHVVIEACGTCLDKPYLHSTNKEICHSCSIGKYNCCEFINFYGLGFSDGGFADYCVISDQHVIPYDPKVVSDDVAALIEPLSVSWHGVRQSKIEPNLNTESLIIGGGPIGLCTIFALRGHKVTNIVLSEPAEARRKLAAKLGVRIFDPKHPIEELRAMTNNSSGFDYIYDCSGNKETFHAMIELLKAGGVGTNIAIWPKIPVDLYPMSLTLNEIYITGSMCYVRKDFELVIEAFNQGLINPKEVQLLITGKVPLKNGIEKGILELIHNKANNIKILLHP